MKIFLTPLDAEGQEGEVSKPFRFVVSFMHPEYDPKQYGFEKFELELDAGAEKGKLILIKGIQDSDSLDRGDVVVDDEKPYGKGFPRVIREYTFEEFCTTPTGIRFDNCVRI